MSNQVYSWKRFWYPRSGRINLADGGYLYDPDAEWGKVYNPDMVTLEAIFDLPCIVLLGEPGIGKSQELQNLKIFIEKKIGDDNQILELNLRSCLNLKDDLFKDEIFIDWLENNYLLYLFLDSLDEGLLNIANIATVLIDELKKKKYKNHINRLHLCLACRTFVFPEILEQGLRDFWQEDQIKIYELAPLRRVDVIEAAKAEGFLPDEFIKEIEQKDIIPLAIKPITLRFLLSIYRKYNSQFPPNQKLHELYWEGCRLLCEEVNLSRRSSNQLGSFESDQRLIAAARIAAITVFANLFAVYTGFNQGDVPTEDVLLQTLCHGYENANDRKFEISELVIREVLDTGLFSSRGLNRMGWAHQVYAEFLAAWYLAEHKVPLEQIKQLIFSPEDLDHKLIPQLHETAAWLSSMRPDVLQEIIETDPDVLLRSDVPTEANVRSSIVHNLLAQYEQGKIFDLNRNNYHNYVKLKHPKLADQLRIYICDSNKQVDARDLAIDIAEVCEISELQEELVSLALDSSQSIFLRVSAAKAICSIGDVATKLKLKSLAIEQVLEDEDDQLKGYALQATWSDHLTAEELFQALTLPKKRNFGGEYKWFLRQELVPKLQPTDLVVALNWLERQGVRCSGHPFEELGDAIILKAWKNFDSPRVIESFTKVVLIQWKENQMIITHNSKLQEQFALSLSNNSNKRHTLIEQAILIISETEEDPYLFFTSETKTLISEDFPWIVEKLLSYSCGKVQKNWLRLIQEEFNYEDARHIDSIIIAIQTSNVLQRIFAPCFEPIELNSIQAERLRTDYLKRQDNRKSYRQNSTLLELPPKARVLQCLENLEAGDLSAWQQLSMEMAKPESNYNSELELDLTKLPGWQEAEEVTRRRIIEGAKKYIQEQNDINYEWIGTNSYDRLALAGCKALQLLLQQNQDFINKLSSEVWKKWVSVIIAIPSNNNKDYYLELVKYAYLNAPKEFIDTVIKLINKNNQEYGDISVIINCLDKCWDEKLKLALLDKVKDIKLKPKCIEQLLEKLLKQGSTEARNFAKSLIYFPLTESEHEKALIAAKVLVKNSDPSNWSFIWSIAQQNLSFGREVFELAACDYSYRIQLNLSETQLADLYFWLVCQYPYNEDTDHSNEIIPYSVTPRDCVVKMRDSVLSQLKERGTLQACIEIQRLIQELPDIDWLGKILIDAQLNRRSKTWQPPQPKEILQIMLDQDKRLIQDGHQLLEVLLESLKRLELELQGETPSCRILWDKDKDDNNIFRPMDENDFSYYVKQFLDRDLKSRGIIVNREVELRRGYGSKGERVDILVDAVLKQPNGETYDSITVIIEVKGCWHRELQTAMDTQLFRRYLANNNCKHGLYLIGWFNCEKWDSRDSRKSKKPTMTIDEARTKFDYQAKTLSSSGIIMRAYVLNATL